MFKAMGTVAEALAALERVVEEKGADYVYNSDKLGNASGECQYAYVEDGVVKPGCIVGYAVYLTEGQEALEFLHENADPRTLGVDDIAPGGFDSNALNVLRQAQNTQDNGGSWGLALAEAREVALLHKED